MKFENKLFADNRVIDHAEISEYQARQVQTLLGRSGEIIPITVTRWKPIQGAPIRLMVPEQNNDGMAEIARMFLDADCTEVRWQKGHESGLGPRHGSGGYAGEGHYVTAQLWSTASVK